MQMMQVQVPAGLSPGMQFQFQFGQQIFSIACPLGARSGSMVQIQIPASPTQQSNQQRGALARDISTRHERTACLKYQLVTE